MRLLLLGCFLLLSLCASWCCIALRSESLVAAETAPPRVADRAVVLDATKSGAEREAAGAQPARAVVVTSLGDDDLIERLRVTARAYLDHDTEALEEHLEQWLAGPSTPRRVLDLVRTGRLAHGTLEEEGAVLVIGFGAGSEVKRPALTVEGRPFTREFLETLALLEAEPAEPIARFSAGLVVEGRPAIGARWLPLIAVLRDREPAHASNFDPIVHAILDRADDIGAASEVQAELALILSSSTDPLTVEAALAVLLTTDPDTFLIVAEELHARSSRAPALAQAIVSAIARHAPVDAAARSLARIANGSQYGVFRWFGARTGALAALEREYSALVATRENPIGRKMLVSAMGTQEAPVLLGIADTDPDPGVRHQALLTLTLNPVEAPAVMSTLRAQHALRGDAANGMSTRAALSVAENLALNGSITVRAEAVQWLKQVVVDPTERMEDRQLAWTKLNARARPEELGGIEAPR